MRPTLAKAYETLTVLARYCDTSKIAETLATLKKVARYYDAGFLATFARCLKLHLFDRFTRKEIFGLGIANPDTPPEVMDEVISVVRAVHLQRAINPKGYDLVTEDKGVFYHFCKGADIRVPQLYAVFDPVLGWAPNGEQLDSRDRWAGFFESAVPDSMVIKPTKGIHGQEVLILHRDQGGFIDFSGRRFTTAELVEALASNREYDRFIVQERMENHPALVDLTGTAALQTVRIVTGIDSRDEVVIFFAAQKLVGGPSGLDRFFLGAEGNYLAELSLDQGRIGKVIAGTEDGLEFAVLETHPRTGNRLAGFQVPYWQDVRDMVSEAACKFRPIRTIGWDVAITPEGPVIIEGNTSWGIDHFSALRNCSPFMNYAREILGTAGTTGPLTGVSRLGGRLPIPQWGSFASGRARRPTSTVASAADLATQKQTWPS